MADENEVLLKLVLRQDWDMPVSLPIPGEPKRGHFAGRDSELAALTNELTRRTNGAILVSGHRGAGKTSLVHRALNQACESDSKILPVLVNAGHIDGGGKDTASNPKGLIESVVRRLYSTAHAMSAARRDVATADGQLHVAATAKKPEVLPTELLESIDALYKKCVATEFKLTESLGFDRSNKTETVVQHLWKLRVDSDKFIVAAHAVGWSLAAALAVFPVISSPTARAVVAVCFAALPTAGSFVWKKARTAIESTAFSAASLYHFDNKLSNLEFDLEVIHRKARDAGWKLVYVIDELDKVDIEGVKLVIAQCKNLFTLSDAIFVFLGDERLYLLGEQPKDQIYNRAKEYTYFNSRYYVGPPSSLELEKFMSDIMLLPLEGDVAEYDKLRHCLFFEAKNDFFDLITAIRGRINGYDGRNPIISIQRPGLEADDIQKARLAVCIASLYEDKYMSISATKWQQNTEMLKEAFGHAAHFTSIDPQLEIEYRNGSDLQSQMIRDFDLLLVKLGALGEERTNQYNNGRGQKKVYPLVAKITTEPSRKLNIATEFEVRYTKACGDFIALLLSVVNVWNKKLGVAELSLSQGLDDFEAVIGQMQKWGFDASGFMGSHSARYIQFRDKKPPYPDKRERIEQLTTEVMNLSVSFRRQLPEVVSSIFFESLPSSDLERIAYQNYDNLLGDEGQPLLTAFRGTTPWVVRRKDHKKRAVFLGNAAEKLNLMSAELGPIMKACEIVCVRETSTDSFPKGIHVVDSETPSAMSLSLTRVLDALTKEFQSVGKAKSTE